MAFYVASRIFLASILLILPSSLLAQTTTENSGRIVEITIPAPSLEGNLLATPNVQDVAIYLPPSYHEQPDRRFPVMYLLHGIFDNYGVWIENFDVPEVLDRMIQSRDFPELIVVMPNGGNRYGGGYYRNSSVSGDWANYIADDLVTYIDETWRTMPNAESRAVVGHSMGGYGAINLAINRPEVFSVVWALSPCCLAPRQDLSLGNDAWKRAFNISGQEDIQKALDNKDFYSIAILGIITAFNPDPQAEPIYGDFPFEIERGEIILDGKAFDKYADEFPVRKVREARDALRSLRGLGMGVGLDDQFLHIPTGTIEFSQRLGAERIPHNLDIYAGDHRQLVTERLEKVVFPWVANRLVVAK